jgi:glycosyltransferase involved in cell wall biosynthesis
LVEGRNLLTIIDAVGGMENHGISLVIGGFGPLEKEVESRAKQYGNITYVGWIPYPDVLSRQSGFDLFIHTTDPGNESQRWVSPAKLFESMALGKPIIVSENTLAAERVKLAGCGVSVRYGSLSDLREALLKFKNDPSSLRTYGERGKAEFSRAWSWETVENRLLEAYRNLGPRASGRARKVSERA